MLFSCFICPFMVQISEQSTRDLTNNASEWMPTLLCQTLSLNIEYQEHYPSFEN